MHMSYKTWALNPPATICPNFVAYVIISNNQWDETTDSTSVPIAAAV